MTSDSCRDQAICGGIFKIANEPVKTNLVLFSWVQPELNLGIPLSWNHLEALRPLLKLGPDISNIMVGDKLHYILPVASNLC